MKRLFLALGILASLSIATVVAAYDYDSYNNYDRYYNNGSYYDYNRPYTTAYTSINSFYTGGSSYYDSGSHYSAGTRCTYKPSNSHWKPGCGYEPHCDWICDSGYIRSGNRCVRDYYDNYDSYGHRDYRDYEHCRQVTVCGYKSGRYQYYSNDCAARNAGAIIVSTTKCQTGSSSFCRNGASNYPYCDRCDSGYTYTVNGCKKTTSCGSLPTNAYWNSGNGYYQDGCNWSCRSGYTRSGSRCIRQSCTNGASNYPYCTTCPSGTYYTNGYCKTGTRCDALPSNAYWVSGSGTYEPNCQWSCQSGYTRVGNACVSNTCSNGTTNYPYCTTCPTGQTYQYGRCVTKSSCGHLPSNAYWLYGNGSYHPRCEWTCRSGYERVGNTCRRQSCSNGATNYPNCNFCPSGQTYRHGRCDYVSHCGSKPYNSSWISGHGTYEPNCEWQCNSGYQRSGNACVAQNCSNGATNYPHCNSCPYGQVYNYGRCEHQTSGQCGYQINTCNSGTFYDTSDSYTEYRWQCRGNGGSAVDCTHPKNNSQNGACGTSLNTCTHGTYSDVTDTSTEYRWQCSGSYGGSTAQCSSPKNNSQNGVCGSTLNTCAYGTFTDIADTTYQYQWQCVGSYGGTTAQCTSPKNTGTDGVCGTTLNTCIQGTFYDYSDTTASHRWQCRGVGGGNTIQCSLPKDQEINGVCGASLNTCISGEFVDQTDTAYHYKWRCRGVHWGTTQDCTQDRVQYSWHVGDYGSCSKVCGGGTKSRQVYCKDSGGNRVSDHLCSGSKPSGGTTSCNTQGCLVWVNTDGYSSCNTVCGGQGRKWVKNKHGESCASGMNRPVDLSGINYRYGTFGGATGGGSVVYNYYDQCFHCYKDGQHRTHEKKNWLVACLCQ